MTSPASQHASPVTRHTCVTVGNGEGWQLFDRLREMCFDVYVEGNFATLGDRLGYVIAANNLQHQVAGHHDGKRETFARAYQRVYGVKLPELKRSKPTPGATR